MKNVKWYNLDQKGFMVSNNVIIRPIKENTACVYIYKHKKGKFYVGSSIDVLTRMSAHRSRVKNYGISFLTYNKFYENVNRYGWEEFQFGIVKSIDFTDNISSKEQRNMLFFLEQEYLDLLNPELNMTKIAGYNLVGSTSNNKIKIRSIEKIKYDKPYTSIKPPMAEETIIKLKLHKNIKVNIYDKYGNFIIQFDKIKKAAAYVGLAHCTVSNYIRTKKLWRNKYYFEIIINK